MIAQILVLALVAGIIGLDRTAAGQFMISQPVVAGPLAGWVLGDAVTGLLIGAILELIWVMDLPVGTFVPANATMLTVWATGAAVLGSQGPVSLPSVGFALLLTAPLVAVTMAVDSVVRMMNARIAEAVENAPDERLARALVKTHVKGLALFFLKYAVPSLVVLPAGVLAVAWFREAPQPLRQAMELLVKLLPLLGVASVARRASIRRLDGFLLLGFGTATTAVLLLPVHPIAIPFLAAAAGSAAAWIQERRSAGRTTAS